MPAIPEWSVILLAIGSAMSVCKYFGGFPRVLARLWIIVFYILVWSDFGGYETSVLAKLSRYGLVLIFLSDIIPAVIAKYQRRKTRGKINELDA